MSFDKCLIPASAWQIVIDAMPKPLPAEVAQADLVHFKDQEKFGKEIPGRRDLAKRWGWSDWHTRMFLEEQKDILSQKSPRNLPEISQKSPAPIRMKLKNNKKISQKSPRNLPEISQDSPTPIISDLLNLSDISDPPIVPQEKFSHPQEKTSAGSPPFLADDNTNVGLQQCFLTSHKTEGQPPSGEKRGFKLPPESEATFAIWQEHRKYHPKVGEKPTKMTFSIVKSAYNLLSGDFNERMDSLVLLVEAANICPDKLFSYDIRAEGWDGGTDRSGDLDTIFRHKKLDMRIQAAKEWAEKGKIRAGPSPPSKNNPFAVNAKHGNYDADFWDQEVEIETPFD